MRRQRILILGSTGSIGRATLDVVKRRPDRFEIRALAARSSVRALTKQIERTGAPVAVLDDRRASRRARTALGDRCDVRWGPGALIDLCAGPEVDIVVAAMNGTSGLLPVLAALEKGKRVAIATKEILVGYGQHVTRVARRHGGEVLPIDSELSALHQCLGNRSWSDVHKVILTASGGPFRLKGPPERAPLSRVLAHPTWRMGRKVTVDSATMINKGLESIETARLFGLAPDQIDAVIHPQSIVHSLLEFRDGSLIAQLSRPDMRLPILYALSWPDRLTAPVHTIRLDRIGRLDFAPIPAGRFPCYDLARRALARGGGEPCVLNAANQSAVDAYLAGRIEFGTIPRIIAVTLEAYRRRPRIAARPGVRTLLRLEAWATDFSADLVRADRRPQSRRESKPE